MFEDDEDVLTVDVDPAVAAVLPYFAQLQSKPVPEVVEEIRQLADSGNIYACYVYGIYHIFGKVPRHYAFHREYPAGEVRQKASISLNERLGLSYLIKLFKFKGQDVQEFHLEGIYDLHKIVEGTAALFKSNDLACRPKSMSDPLYQLFSSSEKIKHLLGRLDHYEAYLDFGIVAIERFERNNKEDDLWTAIDYFSRILGDDLFCRFDQYDLSKANYHMGRLYLYGNDYLPKDSEKGVAHLVAAYSDEAFCELISYYLGYGDKYLRSIKRCIGLIQDEQLKAAKYKECGIAPPEPVDLMTSIQRLLQAAPVQKQQVDLSALVDAQPEPAQERVQESGALAVDDGQTVVSMFEMIGDNQIADSTVPTSMADEFEDDEDLSFFDDDDDDDFAIPDD